VDPFAGLGTTLLAAKTCFLPAVGIEIEERFCELATHRLEQSMLPFPALDGAPDTLAAGHLEGGRD
jgi:tRNA G10  N-methylase Trm11